MQWVGPPCILSKITLQNFPRGAVGHQPERSVAAHLKFSAEPFFPLEILRSLRTEIDALLAFLPSDSTMEKDAHDAQNRKVRKSPTRTVRSGGATRRAEAGAESSTDNAGRSPAHRNRRVDRNRGGPQ